jgi:hypothetical protein
MSTHPRTSNYVLLFRGKDWDKPLSPGEIQQVMSRWTAWMEELSQQGKIKDANPLGRYEGRIVSRKKGQAGTDGPFVESKEAIGGYLLLQVNDLEEAVAIAKQCPALEYGLEVEVRTVVKECPTFQRANEKLTAAVV